MVTGPRSTRWHNGSTAASRASRRSQEADRGETPWLQLAEMRQV